ncbi:unnamed protein product [Closterium sp. NIES-65]|nr:unnamed protein product [Closterium sp. NIES-65]
MGADARPPRAPEQAEEGAEFLSRLLSARPHLSRLSIAPPRFTGTSHFRIDTKFLENFFRVASSRLQELSLRECLGHTTKLPATVASLSSLRVFRLCSKVLRSLPDEMCQLSALQELYLSCPLLQQLPEIFGRLKSLEHLSFTNCKEMRRLPDSLGDLASLTSLHVDGSWQVDRFSPHVGALQQMRRLELRNFTDAFPDACEKWANLEHVALDSCANMGAFQLASVHSLTHLTISACLKLKSLPPNLPFATALRHLTIRSVESIVSLEPLSALVSLERLEVSSDMYEERFPEALFALPSLAYVKVGYVLWVEADDLAHTARTDSSATAAAASTATPVAAAAALAATGGGETAYHNHSSLGPCLEHLSFRVASFGDGWRRGTISPHLCSLLSLTHLSIDGLYSSVSLPSDLGHLTNLHSLSLRGNWLGLPQSLSRLALCLRSLKLHYSKYNMSVSYDRALSSLPHGPHLSHTPPPPQHTPSLPPAWLCPPARPPHAAHRRLSVDSCKKFHHLPDSFSSLPALTFLSIFDCPKFSSLPETFGLLPRLTRLKIADCGSVTHLPGSLSSLPALRVACFSHC